MNDIDLYIKIHSDANPDQIYLHTIDNTNEKEYKPFFYHFAINQHFSPYYITTDYKNGKFTQRVVT